MEDFLAVVLEVLGNLLEDALHGIKNPRKRKWALTIFYSVIALIMSGAFIFLTLVCYKEGKGGATWILSGITGLLILGAVFLIIREHRKNS